VCSSDLYPTHHHHAFLRSLSLKLVSRYPNRIFKKSNRFPWRWTSQLSNCFPILYELIQSQYCFYRSFYLDLSSKWMFAHKDRWIIFTHAGLFWEKAWLWQKSSVYYGEMALLRFTLLEWSGYSGRHCATGICSLTP
jgi:hypothetical protein